MRRHRNEHTKIVACNGYERLRRRWQQIVDEVSVQSGNEHAISIAHDKMEEHRQSCEVCKKEDLAIKAGNTAVVP